MAWLFFFLSGTPRAQGLRAVNSLELQIIRQPRKGQAAAFSFRLPV